MYALGALKDPQSARGPAPTYLKLPFCAYDEVSLRATAAIVEPRYGLRTRLSLQA